VKRARWRRAGEGPPPLVSGGAHLPKEQLPPSTNMNLAAHV